MKDQVESVKTKRQNKFFKFLFKCCVVRILLQLQRRWLWYIIVLDFYMQTYSQNIVHVCVYIGVENVYIYMVLFVKLYFKSFARKVCSFLSLSFLFITSNIFVPVYKMIIKDCHKFILVRYTLHNSVCEITCSKTIIKMCFF